MEGVAHDGENWRLTVREVHLAVPALMRCLSESRGGADASDDAPRHARRRVHGADGTEFARWLSHVPTKSTAPLRELTLARIRELTREPEAVFWVFVFPIILAAILGLAFRSRPPARLAVAVEAGPQAEARRAALASGPDLAPRVLPGAQARQELARGHVVLVVSADATPSYSYDPTHPESRAARLAVDAALQRAAGRTDAFTPREITSTEPGTRYVDFLVPGLLGMNLMGTGMWGIAFSLVVARNGNLLKRLVAAPVRRGHLLGAQLVSRLVFLVPEAGALLLFAYFVLGVPLRGSLLLLAGSIPRGRARLQRLGVAGRGATADDRGRLRAHESHHGPDVDLLWHLFLDGAISGRPAAVRASAAAHGFE